VFTSIDAIGQMLAGLVGGNYRSTDGGAPRASAYTPSHGIPLDGDWPLDAATEWPVSDVELAGMMSPMADAQNPPPAGGANADDGFAQLRQRQVLRMLDAKARAADLSSARSSGRQVCWPLTSASMVTSKSTI